MGANPRPVVNGGAPIAGNQPPVATLTLTPVFKLVFSAVFFITVLCLGVAIYLALHQPNEEIKALNEKVLSVFTLGCGAIIGLLGGKALN
jgi:hypothetical protein